jgi:Tfp pilus assembly protein PilV
MPRTTTQTGFALIDTLIALLLFAVVLLAALAALLQGMHAMHAAMLTGRAVDLAADLLEQHRAQATGAALGPLLTSWNLRIEADLPATTRATALALVQPLLTANQVTAP